MVVAMEISLDTFKTLFSEPVMQFGNRPISLGEVTVAIIVALFALLIWRIAASSSNSKAFAAAEAARDALDAERAHDAETRMAELIASQNELTGRMASMGEMFSTRQGDMVRTVNERLENMSGRIGQSISETTKNTQESLAKLQERLAVIDNAQNNITGLTSQVVELQNILANKQTRGAFGEARMQMIVQDGLPHNGYEFQATLSNSCRPDCLIYMPNDTPSLAIDAKFPLEAWNAIRKAERPEDTKTAGQQFRRDMEVHIKAISEKYLIPGETQDTAFMFVPSESIFAEIHENFEGIIQTAHRARVVIVSPSLLMLSIQVVQSVLKDSRMREQAHLIQGEVIRLMEDVSRLDDRVRKLAGHFQQTQKDVDMILTSTGKVTKRGDKIANLEFDESGSDGGEEQPRLKAVE